MIQNWIITSAVCCVQTMVNLIKPETCDNSVTSTKHYSTFMTSLYSCYEGIPYILGYKSHPRIRRTPTLS